jgi:hypothetical protein
MKLLNSKSSPRITHAALAALCGLIIAGPSYAAAGSGIHSTANFSYVYLAPGGQNTTMSGSSDDMRRARGLRVGNEGLLYVRDRGASYVIRDAVTLREAKALFQPQQELGARQGELGSRQGALGLRQSALGAEQSKLGLQQAHASPVRQRELSRQQAVLGQRQAELGQQQAELGSQQAALGREQARLGQLASQKLRALLVEAVKRGVAQRVN